MVRVGPLMRRLLRGATRSTEHDGTDDTLSSGDYELRVRVLRAGTRSEGRVGRLYRSGVELRGSAIGDTVEAGDVTFVFLGDERPHLWSVSGWARAEEGGTRPDR